MIYNILKQRQTNSNVTAGSDIWNVIVISIAICFSICWSGTICISLCFKCAHHHSIITNCISNESTPYNWKYLIYERSLFLPILPNFMHKYCEGCCSYTSSHSILKLGHGKKSKQIYLQIMGEVLAVMMGSVPVVCMKHKAERFYRQHEYRQREKNQNSRDTAI